MTMDSRPFGFELYEELSSRGLSASVNGGMTYAQIQKFKMAERKEIVKLFSGRSSYATVQHVKEDTPSQLAEYLGEQGKQAGEGAPIVPLFLLLTSWI